jgi:hypothetical protein
VLGECDPSVSIHGIEADQQAERWRQLLGHEQAHALDLGEQRLDLRAPDGILDRRRKWQLDRIELCERAAKPTAERLVELVLVGKYLERIAKPAGAFIQRLRGLDVGANAGERQRTAPVLRSFGLAWSSDAPSGASSFNAITLCNAVCRLLSRSPLASSAAK